MTIKEMCKVFKKLEKLEDEFTRAKINLENITVYGNLEYINEQAKQLAKVAAAMSKISKAMDVDSQVLMENVITEEHFCKWCLVNDVIYWTEETESDECLRALQGGHSLTAQ